MVTRGGPSGSPLVLSRRVWLVLRASRSRSVGRTPAGASGQMMGPIAPERVRDGAWPVALNPQGCA